MANTHSGRHNGARMVALLVLLSCLLLVAGVSISADRAEPDQPLSPTEAARTMSVPEGFQVTLFAGEPDVRQPIGFCLDDRGRLWVAEAYNYPNHGTRPGDRIVILEDADGDGRFDRRKVFYDELNYVTGIEVGFGGVWIMSPPYFYFIADRDGDDRPDGEPEVLLDGFGNHANSHNLANGFAWGPDGWLYGTHGRTNWSMIGKAGAAKSERERFDGGVWRYHPVRHVWEPYADGTTNPWGIDWDDYGEAFVCNCVNPHLFHVIQGAHYEPWRNRESSRYAYQRIDTIADHLHFTGGSDVRGGLGSEEEHDAGGGHAHCGTMVYLGDNWPDRYRNTVFMNNIHGKRINNDRLKRLGSGYTASHGPDFMLAQDTWYMGVTLLYGPGGEVYASDWSDTGECHSVRNTQRATGRIYRITYGELTVPRVDLAARTTAELVALQTHKNDWYVRHARRLLQERYAADEPMGAAHAELHALFAAGETRVALRALWALKVTGGLTDDFLVAQLDHPSEYVRAWAVRLLCEDRDPPPAALAKFQSLAAKGDSQLVRLHLASSLQRLPFDSRWPIAEALAARGEDQHDANLPLMLWYAVEPLIYADRERLIALAGSTRIPLLRRHIARRVASSPDDNAAGLNALIAELGRIESAAARGELLEGILKGLEGRRSVPVPDLWPASYAKLQVAADDPSATHVMEQAIRLALLFDDQLARQQLLAVVDDADHRAADRRLALEALVEAKVDGLAPRLLALIDDPQLQLAALRGLARFDHPRTAERILSRYGELEDSSKQAALQTLASRPAWGAALLDALSRGVIDRIEINAYTARQLQSLNDRHISRRLEQLWGEVRSTPKERVRQIDALRSRLSPDALAAADLSAGRGVFRKACANCHRLFDEGGKIGPDITGSQRRNLDYLLENVVDPSAAVARDYLAEIVQTEQGRVLSGLVVEETEQALTIQTIDERIVIPADEIAARKTSSVSMMPEGLLQPLTAEEVRDLFAYLQSKSQVAAP